MQHRRGGGAPGGARINPPAILYGGPGPHAATPQPLCPICALSLPRRSSRPEAGCAVPTSPAIWRFFRLGLWTARCCAPLAPFLLSVCTHNARFPRGHLVVPNDPRGEERAAQVPRETTGQVVVGVGIPLGRAPQCAIHQRERGHKVLALERGRGNLTALPRCEPPVYLGRHPVRCTQELFQPEHVLAERFQGAFPGRVVVGDLAELFLDCVR